MNGIKMGIVKNFIDELSKHKLLVYFVTLWGASLFLWTIYGIVAYRFEMNALGVLDILYHLSQLFAGALLVVFGLKLMNTNLLTTIKNERLLVYFLILWAASFFFIGLYNVIDFGSYIFNFDEDVIGFLGALADLFAGIVLALFGWKLLGEKE
jgi:hypothetical protein